MCGSYILANINAVPFGLSYRDGLSAMAMALYMQTGGPGYYGDHPSGFYYETG